MYDTINALFMDIAIILIISLPILIYSAILHEIAHGYVADRLGDPTARLMGRLTLNPIKHIDLYMSILLPLFLLIFHSPVLFGGAKPVPIDPFNLKDGKKDVALVSLAGPLTNLVLAGLFALLIHISFLFKASAGIAIFQFIAQLVVEMNIYLAIFNLLPIPPLDGSKVFALLLPDREAIAFTSMGNIGIIILFLLLSFPFGGFFLPDFMQHMYTIVYRFLGI